MIVFRSKKTAQPHSKTINFTLSATKTRVAEPKGEMKSRREKDICSKGVSEEFPESNESWKRNNG